VILKGANDTIDVKKLPKKPAPARFGRKLTAAQKARATHLCVDCGYVSAFPVLVFLIFLSGGALWVAWRGSLLGWVWHLNMCFCGVGSWGQGWLACCGVAARWRAVGQAAHQRLVDIVSALLGLHVPYSAERPT
jgi:hypothetical protein